MCKTLWLNGEKLNAFYLRSGTREKCLISPLLFNTVPAVLTSKWGRKEHIDKKKRKIKKLSLFVDHMIVLETHKETPCDQGHKIQDPHKEMNCIPPS
jgi:hypothetical protein